MNYPDSNYCIVGVSAFDMKSKEGFMQEIDKLRNLTDKEKEICESMVKKIKQKNKAQ